MQIHVILTQRHNDFTAQLKCPHCGHIQYLGTGYSDDYYRDRVLPSITCLACGKDESGAIPEEPNPYGNKSV